MNVVVADDKLKEEDKFCHDICVLQTGVPSFLTTMEKACEGYEKYLQKKCTK